MRYLPAALLAVAIVLAPVVWHLSEGLFERPTLEAEEMRLREQVTELRERVARLSERVDGLDARTALMTRPGESGRDDDTGPNPDASDSLSNAFAQVVLIAERRHVNAGLTHASPRYLEELLGLPREDLTDQCQAPTSPALLALLKTEDVGPIRVRMLEPALISLRQVFANVEVFEPELHARITSAGSLCVRRIRGSEEAASAHAYGLAVDLNIDGHLDTLGDGQTQLGLTLLADFFRREGWIWGAGFGREDSMHFEVSREKLEQWRRLGQI